MSDMGNHKDENQGTKKPRNVRNCYIHNQMFSGGEPLNSGSGAGPVGKHGGMKSVYSWRVEGEIVDVLTVEFTEKDDIITLNVSACEEVGLDSRFQFVKYTKR